MTFLVFSTVTVVASGSIAPHLNVDARIDAIKRGLLSEHRSAWGDILIPDTNRTTQNNYNMTAISEAMRKADEVAWQWGFWPFTSISDL